MPVWDTTVVARLHPGSALEADLVRRAGAGAPVAMGEPTVMEVVHGLQAAAPAALPWFVDLVCGDLVEVLPLDREAAVVAGRLRALHPVPPAAAGPGAGRGGAGRRTRAGWRLDEQIAACAWVHGRTLATENVADFRVLGDLISDLYPGTSPLVVTGVELDGEPAL